MRIVYSTFPEAVSECVSLRFPRCLSHRVFIPSLRKCDEDVKATDAIQAVKVKMSLWSATLQGNILCAESLTVEYNPSGGGGGAQDSHSSAVPSKSDLSNTPRTSKVVLYFRVYTDCPDIRAKADSPVSMVSQARVYGGRDQTRCRLL